MRDRRRPVLAPASRGRRAGSGRGRCADSAGRTGAARCRPPRAWPERCSASIRRIATASVKARLAARRYCSAAPAKSPRDAERVADQDMDFGRAGIVGLEPAGAGQRLVAEAAGEQGRDQPDLGRAVARILARRRGARRRTRLRRADRARRARRAAAGRRGRGRARRASASPCRASARPISDSAVSVGVGPVGDRAQRRDRRRRHRPSATGRRRAGGGRGGCRAARATSRGEAARRLLLIAGLEVDRARASSMPAGVSSKAPRVRFQRRRASSKLRARAASTACR